MTWLPLINCLSLTVDLDCHVGTDGGALGTGGTPVFFGLFELYRIVPFLIQLIRRFNVPPGAHIHAKITSLASFSIDRNSTFCRFLCHDSFRSAVSGKRLHRASVNACASSARDVYVSRRMLCDRKTTFIEGAFSFVNLHVNVSGGQKFFCKTHPFCYTSGVLPCRSLSRRAIPPAFGPSHAVSRRRGEWNPVSFLIARSTDHAARRDA